MLGLVGVTLFSLRRARRWQGELLAVNTGSIIIVTAPRE